ncbi:MAG: hypothetical protein TH68_02060 [Candidatus Synechococcus spongiarum 142]|uniref:Uncharacterized protein n=1 Tax=Candidatus Synechococcus spongiarum 142 TaxID=1608213 RepID=A0A6N3XD92_9SYNE|nr:MAG: hypothetical protein TH68_02060 [Candidatus Synechococcus spongiarum 142]
MMVMFPVILRDVIMMVNGVGDSMETILLMECLKQWGELLPQHLVMENIQLWFHGLLTKHLEVVSIVKGDVMAQY